MHKQTRAWVELDSSALINNVMLAKANTNASVMAVVKANAYGHGIEFVSETLAPYVDAFAVATLEEAMTLRAVNCEKAIVCLSGFSSAIQLKEFERLGISLVVYNMTQVEWLEAHGEYRPPIWIKLDTGMTRLGFSPRGFEGAISRLKKVNHQLGLMSHFARADQPEVEQNQIQHESFKQSIQGRALPCSFCNSAALLTRPQDHYDLVRPGLMLYGSTPLEKECASSLGLMPVMRFYARLIDIKNVAAGATVGYGATWTAVKACKLGVISVGYGDGYPRSVSEHTQLAIRGRRYNIIGRISMDMMMVLLDDSEVCEIGDVAELWGETISIDEVAIWANSISYELPTKITNRVAKIAM